LQCCHLRGSGGEEKDGRSRAVAVAQALNPGEDDMHGCKSVAELACGCALAILQRFGAFSDDDGGPVRRRSILSKLRLAAGILVVVAVMTAGMGVAIAKQQQRKETQPTRAEYTVAAASTGESTGASPRMAIPMLRRGALGPLPDTLTLVVVGGLLLGLAAAVRRTT
jgi:hypothetical protein